MVNIELLKAKRQKLIDEMRQITVTAEKREDKKQTEDEEKRWNELNTKTNKMALEIREAEENEKRLAAEARPVGSNWDNRTIPARGRDYRSMFGHGEYSLDDGGFKDANEFFNVLFSNRHDDRLLKLNEKRSQQTLIEHLGGFSCPENMSQIILDKSLESEIVRSRATIWPMDVQTKKVPVWDCEDKNSDGIAGLIGVWLEELGTGTVDDALLRQIELKLKKLAIFTAASKEVLSFSPNFGTNLMDVMSQAISFYLDDACFNGSGAGMPVGIIDAACTIEVARQTANTIEFDDVVNLLARLLPSSYGRAVWVASQTILSDLMLTGSKIEVGTGGSYVPLVHQEGNTFSMLGIPLLFSEKVPSLGNKGDLGIYDLSKYYIGLYKDVIIETSNAVSWETVRQDFRSVLLVDGQPMYSQPIVQKDGGTVSPFVVLDNDTTTTAEPV